MRRLRLPFVLALMFVVALLAGIGPAGQPAQAATCGGLLQPPCPSPSPSPSPSPEPDPNVPPPSHTCHQLTLDEFNAAVDTKPAVPCSEQHNGYTVTTPLLRRATQWSDQDSIWQQAYAPCVNAAAQQVGGWRTYLMSMYLISIYKPTKSQWSQGARWVRCDIALLGTKPVLQSLPQPVDSTLTQREAHCNAGRSSDYREVPCSRRHQFRTASPIHMKTWNGTKAAQTFTIRACLRRYPDGDFLFFYPHTRRSFDAGFRFAVCAPKNRS